jgi:hypothetical protein
VAGGEAAITNWDLVYKHQVHIIGLNIGVLIQTAPRIFGELMGERANGIVVVAPTATGVSRVIAFHHDPALVGMFGFQDTLAGDYSATQLR